MHLEFPKNFETKQSEKKWYKNWKNSDIFVANNKSDKKPFSILMPPPNVTGILHFGHVLNHTLQDLYIRRKRMQGYEVCWFPGLDHAGIATQSRVEKELKNTENLTRYDLGRDKFVEKVWQWKDKYGGIILEQLESIGVSCDWSRTLFTMDESASYSVADVFIKLFDEGLIYRGKRIINWSPLAQTALSDEEVEFKEVTDKLYTLRYQFKEGNGSLMVATARPETIYGDVAIAVNPNDERYKELIGKTVLIPLVNKEIPVIADDYADPAFGTGCVKITPAHDPNDFEVGLRHNLEQINTINPDGTMNELTGEFKGLDRFVAREKFVSKLQELGAIEKIEDYTHNVGFSQRGGEPIEPYLSDQWFVKMKPLAEIALEDVLNNNIKFHPNHWVKTYEHWMKNIRDWCISRQLWWGHRIPVYYALDGRFTAAHSENEARTKLNLDVNAELRQEEDVLDTWFSSWLWPLTTMKWQENGIENTDDMQKFLPSDLLVTGPDIIFFWVARMVMATKKFNAQIPFQNVYFTSMIRDGKGRKLSKSLGNSPNPLNIIDKYGADAVRFTMIYLSPLGQDVRMDVDVESQDIPSMDLGRNFINKVWNAGRFLDMRRNQAKENVAIDFTLTLHQEELSEGDKWIQSKLNSVVNDLEIALDNFKVNDYSKILYDFIWKDFCDWYVEIVKIQFANSDSNEYKMKLMNFALDIYNNILMLLHPIAPFVTEELWHLINPQYSENDSISMQNLPNAKSELISNEIEHQFTELQFVIDEIRKLRASANIPPSKPIEIVISTEDNTRLEMLKKSSKTLISLVKCSNLEMITKFDKSGSYISSAGRGIQISVLAEGLIDVEKEREKLEKEIQRLSGQVLGISKKLENEKFVSNAPEQVLANERKKLADMSEAIIKMKESLAAL